MKRLIGAGVVAVLAALPLSHVVLAGAPPKVYLCHVESEPQPHVIWVSEHAVPAHLAHGDCVLDSGVPGEDCTCK